MRKFISTILAIILATMSLCVFVSAKESEAITTTKVVSSERIVLDDGSILTTTIEIEEPKIVTLATTQRITASKIVKNEKDGELFWEYVLKGEFTVVEGVSSVCTNAYYTYTINDSKWSINDASTWYSGNTAYGYCVFKKKVLFITTNNVTVDISLTCDIYGALS